MEGDLNPVSFKTFVKNLDGYLWNLTNNITCTICCELFKDPITTPCGHSFCSNCMKTLLYGANNSKGSCPLCRHPIKRREAKNNHVLSKIARLCSELPAAFKEDVMGIANSPLKKTAEELLETSRICEMTSEKVRGLDKTLKSGGGLQDKSSKKNKLKDSVVNNSLLNLSYEYGKDLKSVSQIDLKTQSSVVTDSPDIKKTLRRVKEIPSKEKVNDWLRRNDKKNVGCSYINDDTSIITHSNTSMVRIDYDKTKKSNASKGNLPGNEVNDPYEFIASQKNTISKGSRKRKKKKIKPLPDFEAVQNFTKSSIKKTSDYFGCDVMNLSIASSDVNDETLQKTYKTYSRKSDKTVTYIESNKKVNRSPFSKRTKNTLDNEDSNASSSKPCARKRLLPCCSDTESDNSIELTGRMKKENKISGDVHSESGHKSSGETSTICKNPGLLVNNSRSPGWSRVSNLKVDFETVDRRKHRRKTLNISGGELNPNSSKINDVPEDAVECGKEEIIDNDCLYIEDLSQSSELLIGFDSVSSTEKEKDFKLMVENMKLELEGNEVHENNVGNESYRMTEATEKNFVQETIEKEPVRKESVGKDLVQKIPNPRLITFALLGRIMRKKKSAILFLKLGKLNYSRKRSHSSVVKLIFPKGFSKSIKKQSAVNVGIQTDFIIMQRQCDVSPKVKNLNTRVDSSTQCINLEEKVDAHIQTSLSFLRSSTKEVQTSQRIERKSVDVQTAKPDEERIRKSSLEFHDISTVKSAIQKHLNKGENELVYLDSELQSELNKSWITQEKYVQIVNSKEMNVDSSTHKQECNEEFIDLVSMGTDSSMQKVINNINLDLARVKATSVYSSPTKTVRQSEPEESDSDIFIDQTPPRNTSGLQIINEDQNKSTLCNVKPDLKEAEESFLLLSNSQSKIPDDQNPLEIGVKKNCSLPQKNFSMEKSEPFDSGCKENDENNKNHLNMMEEEEKVQNTIKDKEFGERKICIVSSGVLNRKNIEKFITNFKVEHLNYPSKKMTHLVVGLHENEDDELVPYCTPKLLFAIANKKWVVTEGWIEACLTEKSIVAEEPFESVDPAGGSGCSAARLSNDLLLKSCEVYLLGKYERITREEFSGLIEDCGGTIVRQPGGFSYTPDKIRMILVDSSDIQDNTNVESIIRKYRTLVMSRDVIIVSIQSYKIINFTPFLIHSPSVEECVKWGYPYELVKKDSEYDKDDSGSDDES